MLISKLVPIALLVAGLFVGASARAEDESAGSGHSNGQLTKKDEAKVKKEQAAAKKKADIKAKKEQAAKKVADAKAKKELAAAKKSGKHGKLHGGDGESSDDEGWSCYDSVLDASPGAAPNAQNSPNDTSCGFGGGGRNTGHLVCYGPLQEDGKLANGDLMPHDQTCRSQQYSCKCFAAAKN